MKQTTLQPVRDRETIQVGPDRVTIQGEKVLIDARHKMPDWQVREYSRIPIHFRDKKYYLGQTAPGQKPFAIRYLLEPWPADSGVSTSVSLTYDEATVAEREADISSERVNDMGRAALIMFYPFLGLLWSRTKERLVRFGFVPRTMTGASIFVTFSLILMQGAFAKMLMVMSMRSGHLQLGGIIRAFVGQDHLNLVLFQLPVFWLDVALVVFLILDTIIRFAQHMREEQSPWGFLEWLNCLLPRRQTLAATAGPEEPAASKVEAKSTPLVMETPSAPLPLPPPPPAVLASEPAPSAERKPIVFSPGTAFFRTTPLNKAADKSPGPIPMKSTAAAEAATPPEDTARVA